MEYKKETNFVKSSTTPYLAPAEHRVYVQGTKTIDLGERRKMDKEKILSEVDKKVFLEQQKTGAVLDRMVKREQFLVKNKKQILGDDSLFLYRLPLNEEQIKNMYESIMTDSN
mgnify:CR=1 FL=1